MKSVINIKSLGKEKKFEAINENGNRIVADGSSSKEGMRPMELLLSALGTCSAFDATDIIKKQRQELKSFDIKLTGVRPDEGYPKPFESAHFEITISGKVDPEKAQRAVELSINKYCSVKESLNPHIPVTFSVNVVEQ